MKRFISLLVTILMSVLCFAVPVYASSDDDPNFTTASITRDNNIPTATWDLSTYGTYYFSGYAQNSAPLYTLYNFTGKSTFHIVVTNLGYTMITVRLYKNGIIDTEQTNFSVAAGNTAEIWVTGLSASSKYYLQFSAPCSFSGYIE